MISQFYVLSPRGDTIINRDFRGDIVKGTAEIFFRKVKFWSGDPPPVFPLDGITYVFLKRNGLYFVATTQQNISPAYCLELLQQMTKVFRDFCGVLNEEAIRRNFVLIYEILDEVIDGGYPQLTSTERLKECVHNEAVVVIDSSQSSQKASGKGLFALGSGMGTSVVAPGFQTNNPKTVPSNASHRPVGPVQQSSSSLLDGTTAGSVLALTRTTLGNAVGVPTPSKAKNEIFVDILERLTIVMSSSGQVLNSQVDGCIQMKSYLAGSPPLRLALNEDVIIKNNNELIQTNTGPLYRNGTTPQLDDCNFHECVDLKDFDSFKVMTINPPDGEFVVMNYRITDEFPVPFKIRPVIEQTAPNKLELSISVRADISTNQYGGNVTLSCPVPRNSLSVSSEAFPRVVPQTLDFLQQENRVVWNVKKFQGGSEMSLKCKITLSQPLPTNLPQHTLLTLLRKEIGPLSLSFEIPVYNVSNLQVRYLRVSDAVAGAPAPFRWVRYVTQSSSYVCRL